ncbi:PP2C family protein-serine/threonine phosphatase [Streptomyces althioticus]|uniref:PP2C family protein-serine/threonine phosphatase n=1 Tax=Streptomyces althioticus TaxID=83380 RepID=UPI0033D534A4
MPAPRTGHTVPVRAPGAAERSGLPQRPRGSGSSRRPQGQVPRGAARCAPPAGVLVRTNRLLTGLGPGLFTSCLYVHLARHRARLAGAGHPPPVLRRPDGRAQVLRVPPNLLLGVDAADCTCTQVDLPPGSVLVLCTDGLVEVPGTDLLDSFEALAARRADAGDLDEEGLADVLVEDVRRSAHRSDDVALLLRTR